MLLTKIKSNKSLIFEFDNPIPHWAVISGDYLFKKFSFEYGHHAASLDDGVSYFGKMLYLREKNISFPVPVIVQNVVDCIQLDLLPQLDPNGKFVELQRIAVNGQTSSQAPSPHIDTDTDSSLWTAIYYVNDSSGDTVFYNTISDLTAIYRTKFKQGKIVIFPACFCHQALPPEKDFRISVGITFEWHTDLFKNLKS
jgi:hypothetical protein